MTFLPRLPLSVSPPSEEHAERMGFDAGYNKPDETNCHFSLFATRALTTAWERGKKRGEEKRASPSTDGKKP